jgi:hypothetical protein
LENIQGRLKITGATAKALIENGFFENRGKNTLHTYIAFEMKKLFAILML